VLSELYYNSLTSSGLRGKLCRLAYSKAEQKCREGEGRRGETDLSLVDPTPASSDARASVTRWSHLRSSQLQMSIGMNTETKLRQQQGRNSSKRPSELTGFGGAGGDGGGDRSTQPSCSPTATPMHHRRPGHFTLFSGHRPYRSSPWPSKHTSAATSPASPCSHASTNTTAVVKRLMRQQNQGGGSKPAADEAIFTWSAVGKLPDDLWGEADWAVVEQGPTPARRNLRCKQRLLCKQAEIVREKSAMRTRMEAMLNSSELVWPDIARAESFGGLACCDLAKLTARSNEREEKFAPLLPAP